MTESKNKKWSLFWASWGIVVVFFQLPMVKMIQGDPQSLSLGSWNWLSFSIFNFLTFIVIPACFSLLIVASSIPGERFAKILFSIILSYLVTFQIRYFKMDDQLGVIAITILVVVFLIVFFASHKLSRIVHEILKILPLLSIGIFGFFLTIGLPHSFSKSDKPEPPQIPKSNEENAIPPVFFLSFEKLVQSYFLDDQGQINSKQFPNLAELVGGADYYPNAYANSMATIVGLKVMYAGRLGHRVKANWEVEPNLAGILGKDRNVFMILDITNYCNPNKYYCFRSVGVDKLQGADIIIGWYKTFSKTLMPKSIQKHFDLDGWKFDPWVDMWDRETDSDEGEQKVFQEIGKRQFEILKNIVLKEGHNPNLYIMHNFISDGVSVKKSKYLGHSDEEYGENLKNTRTELQKFDRELGIFIDFLKENKIYDKSLIVLTSDTGYENYIYKTKELEPLPVMDDLLKILVTIKRPNQKQGRVISAALQQLDLLPTLLTGIGIDVSKMDFEGVPVVDPNDKTSIDKRRYIFHAYVQGKKIFYELFLNKGILTSK